MVQQGQWSYPEPGECRTACPPISPSLTYGRGLCSHAFGFGLGRAAILSHVCIKEPHHPAVECIISMQCIIINPCKPYLTASAPRLTHPLACSACCTTSWRSRPACVGC
jgi:hypothetical protein